MVFIEMTALGWTRSPKKYQLVPIAKKFSTNNKKKCNVDEVI